VQLRHEQKFWIRWPQYHRMRSHLRALLRPDPNADSSGEYHIRSLYYDTPRAEAAFEKLSGLQNRRKFRIRIYNKEDSLIRLEIKHRIGNRIGKQSCKLSRTHTNRLLLGELPLIARSPQEIQQLYLEMTQRLAKPAVIVDYVREAYVHPLGNVRITFDKNLRCSQHGAGLFDEGLPTLPVHASEQLILEIKYDSFLPTSIQKIIPGTLAGPVAISKYYHCRLKIHSWENGA
jgi:hypothetical protein